MVELVNYKKYIDLINMFLFSLLVVLFLGWQDIVVIPETRREVEEADHLGRRTGMYNLFIL